MKVACLLLICLLGLSHGYEDVTIAQWLVKNNYDTMVYALTQIGLMSTLNSTGPFTVFVPTDAVFNKLGADVVSGLLNDTNKLALIVKYHVINEFVLVSMINSPVNKTTLNGESLMLEPSGGGLLINNMSRVSASNNDIVLNNGVVQPIDELLSPSNVPSLTIVQTLITQGGEFADLSLALILAQLTTTLDQGVYTVFGPVDAAFARYKDNILSPSDPNIEQIRKAVLLNHVVAGTYPASQLYNGQKLVSLHGTTLTVTIDASGVRINNARVIDADIMATNGVIHGIDDFLFPSDLQIPQG